MNNIYFKSYLENYFSEDVYTFGIEIEFRVKDNKIDKKVKEYFKFIKYNLQQKIVNSNNNIDYNYWSIDIENGQVEIRTKILYLNNFDFDLLSELIDKLNQDKEIEYSLNSSCHIHIGLPKYFELFNCLYIIEHIEENEFLKLYPNRDFYQWARLKRNFTFSTYPKGSNIYEKLMNYLKEKYVGISFRNFFLNKTIEFRYLPSSILNDKEMLRYYLFNFINLCRLSYKWSNRETFPFFELIIDKNYYVVGFYIK